MPVTPSPPPAGLAGLTVTPAGRPGRRDAGTTDRRRGWAGPGAGYRGQNKQGQTNLEISGQKQVNKRPNLRKTANLANRERLPQCGP